jgi:hypothetical protein
MDVDVPKRNDNPRRSHLPNIVNSLQAAMAAIRLSCQDVLSYMEAFMLQKVPPSPEVMAMLYVKYKRADLTRLSHRVDDCVMFDVVGDGAR